MKKQDKTKSKVKKKEEKFSLPSEKYIFIETYERLRSKSEFFAFIALSIFMCFLKRKLGLEEKIYLVSNLIELEELDKYIKDLIVQGVKKGVLN